MEYLDFKYIYPPRPENKATPATLDFIFSRGFIAQPKLNGSNAIVATNGEEVHIMNRHKETFSRMLINNETLRNMHIGPKGTWCYFCGEYMNKAQRDHKGDQFNGVYVIFDLLVYDNVYLVGKSLIDRYSILEKEFKTEIIDDYLLSTDREKCYLVRNIEENKWYEIIQIEMMEGFVFKDPEAELEISTTQKNNTGWMVKIRKPTKNYKF